MWFQSSTESTHEQEALGNKDLLCKNAFIDQCSINKNHAQSVRSWVMLATNLPFLANSYVSRPFSLLSHCHCHLLDTKSSKSTLTSKGVCHLHEIQRWHLQQCLHSLCRDHPAQRQARYQQGILAGDRLFLPKTLNSTPFNTEAPYAAQATWSPPYIIQAALLPKPHSFIQTLLICFVNVANLCLIYCKWFMIFISPPIIFPSYFTSFTKSLIPQSLVPQDDLKFSFKTSSQMPP